MKVRTPYLSANFLSEITERWRLECANLGQSSAATISGAPDILIIEKGAPEQDPNARRSVLAPSVFRGE